MGPLATVEQELLVRCLDAWTPAALHSGRPVSYVDGHATGATVMAAIRVFVEFADVLAGHHLTVVLAGEFPGDPDELPDGLRIGTSDFKGPTFGYFDSVPPDLLKTFGGARAADVLFALEPGPDPEDLRRSLLAAGFTFAVVVELVDNAGQAKRLFFTTSGVRSLERFKDALWAVDEYAGVRYRDPRADDHPPLDISLEPHVGPLRRALLARLAGGEETVARLREYALSDTLYRPVDVNRALAPMLAAGQVTRDPVRGRLTPQTVIRSHRAG